VRVRPASWRGRIYELGYGCYGWSGSSGSLLVAGELRAQRAGIFWVLPLGTLLVAYRAAVTKRVRPGSLRGAASRGAAVVR
jgi:hypothetical protein